MWQPNWTGKGGICVQSVTAKLTRTSTFESYRHLHCLEALVADHPDPGGKDPPVIDETHHSAKRRDYRADALTCLGCRPQDPATEIPGRPWKNGRFDCTREGRVWELVDLGAIFDWFATVLRLIWACGLMHRLLTAGEPRKFR